LSREVPFTGGTADHSGQFFGLDAGGPCRPDCFGHAWEFTSTMRTLVDSSAPDKSLIIERLIRVKQQVEFQDGESL
jgi:hypothetical protein